MTQQILQTLSDEQLVTETIKGNKKGFEILYHRYKDKIYNYILRLLNFNKQETETIITETFLKTYTYIKDKQPKISNFKSFIYKTAHNLSVNFIQKENKQNFMQTEHFEYIKSNEDENLKKKVNNEFRQQIIHQLLQRLDGPHREVIYLYYFEQQNYEQIAKITNSNKNSVGTLLLKAKNNLKKLAQTYGYDNIL